MFIPVHPDKFQPSGMIVEHFRACVDDIHMVNPKHTPIHKHVTIVTIVRSEDHDVAMLCHWIDSVLSLLNIVGCVVDLHYVVGIHPVVLE